MVFYVNKTKLRIEYSFLLMIAFAVFMKNSNTIYLLLFSSLHELGHLAFLIAFKGRAKEINVAFYGIGLKYDYSFTFIKELLFLAAGVAINAVFCFIGIQKEINGALAFINILPIYPLDGGRAVKLVLNKAFCLDLSDRIFKLISVITIVLLIAYSFSTNNYSLILITIYIIIFSVNNTAD